jgi:hypothetical protein
MEAAVERARDWPELRHGGHIESLKGALAKPIKRDED